MGDRLTDPRTSGEAAGFLFADLVGFTELTERLGDEAAADLALGFCDRVCQLNRSHGAADVNTMGDGALIRIPDPVEAVRLAVCITREIGPERGFPLVRVGLDHGPAVSRRGDWFGATINTASRIVSLADAGEVLITSRARTAAGETGHGIDFEDSGLRQLRHITDPVRLYRASPHRAA